MDFSFHGRISILARFFALAFLPSYLGGLIRHTQPDQNILLSDSLVQSASLSRFGKKIRQRLACQRLPLAA
jgi:hypothetical protein